MNAAAYLRMLVRYTDGEGFEFGDFHGSNSLKSKVRYGGVSIRMSVYLAFLPYLKE